jgi:hypothetical protein
MLKLITSLSFLYALTIIVLMVYGWMYYRDFVRSALHRGRFPQSFSLSAWVALPFLINIHVYGFKHSAILIIILSGTMDLLSIKIELGRTDTINFDNNAFNSFSLFQEE